MTRRQIRPPLDIQRLVHWRKYEYCTGGALRGRCRWSRPGSRLRSACHDSATAVGSIRISACCSSYRNKWRVQLWLGTATLWAFLSQFHQQKLQLRRNIYLYNSNALPMSDANNSLDGMGNRVKVPAMISYEYEWMLTSSSMKFQSIFPTNQIFQ